MPWEVKIRITQEVAPSPLDRLFGFLWFWNVGQSDGPFSYTKILKSGFARTEKAARRKAEKVAARYLEGHVEYTYDPRGLTPPEQGR